MKNEKEFDELAAVDILAKVLAVVFDTSKTADEIREEVREILKTA